VVPSTGEVLVSDWGRHCVIRFRSIDDDTLVGSVLRTLAAAQLRAQVVTGEPEHHAGRDRRQWAQELRERVHALRADGSTG
jgi:hypothetical protein